jgi:hypothetical protein
VPRAPAKKPRRKRVLECVVAFKARVREGDERLAPAWERAASDVYACTVTRGRNVNEANMRRAILLATPLAMGSHAALDGEEHEPGCTCRHEAIIAALVATQLAPFASPTVMFNTMREDLTKYLRDRS